jgi:raffinose/stachyose/melibiose transport system permease protein
MGLFRYTWRSFSRELLLIAGAAVFCVPAYVLGVMSLKTTSETYLQPLTFPLHPRIANYSDAWKQGGATGLGGSAKASAIITVSSVVVLVVLGSLCAYAIARRPSKLGGALYVLFVLGIILPFQLAIIPVYVALRYVHLTGTYLGVILLYTGLLMPFSVFLFTGFIRALPRDYEEAAQVDGAGLLRTYLRVVFPLLLPVTGTVAILAGLFIWNDFFLALIFIYGSKTQTLPLALFSFVGEYVSQWNLIMAAVVISIAPILAFYLFAQRQLIRGFAGGIRG